MQVIHERCAALDGHKKTVVTTIMITQDLHEKGSPPSMKKSRILAGDASSKIVRT
jgi:hypothetical protein